MIKDIALKEHDEINQKGIEILDEIKFELLKKKFREDIK